MEYLRGVINRTNSVCNQSESIFNNLFTVSEKDIFVFSNAFLVQKDLSFVQEKNMSNLFICSYIINK